MKNMINTRNKTGTTIFLLWLLLAFATFSSVAAQQSTFKKTKDKVGWAYDPAERFFALTDDKDNLLTGFDFEAPSTFEEGTAIVKKDSLYYFLWENGRLSER